MDKIGERVYHWSYERTNAENYHMDERGFEAYAFLNVRWHPESEEARRAKERRFNGYWHGDRLRDLDDSDFAIDDESDKVRKRGIAEAARAWMKYPYVVFDSETTGLEEDAEIVSIGIVSHRGEVLLDTLIKPVYPIPHEATLIHGIHDALVADAPTFEEVYPLIRSAMQAKRWAGYNISFDMEKLAYQVRKRGMEPISPAKCWDEWLIDDVWDVMRPYAEWWGEWNEYYGNYRWQKLANARKRHKLHRGRDHGALDDAITTLRLIEFLGGYDG